MGQTRRFGIPIDRLYSIFTYLLTMAGMLITAVFLIPALPTCLAKEGAVASGCIPGVMFIFSQVISLGSIVGLSVFSLGIALQFYHQPASDHHPEYISRELGTAIFEEADQWRSIHYESGMEVTADDQHAAAEQMKDKLREHGWLRD
ncbi:hypothetical protein [Haladaptatus sp. CMAA 1911]|uniref:hypothetical protein n=1 Tax=unclassified Haladaptatus TaxID=2622732 RepID=UPI0037552F48